MKDRLAAAGWKQEVRRWPEQAPLPEWVAWLDRLAFGDAWTSLASHEALWVVPELAFARWSRVPAAGEAELLRIAVAPGARGQGLGRVLLEACQRELAAEGLVHLFLEVRPTNASAIRLYEACGWEPCGRRPRYYSDGEDALLFQRVG
ncbi:MAG TPA: GNAT family N-acetyltransferase [Geothrix sp.]